MTDAVDRLCSKTLQLAKALQPHGLKWIEECLPPDDYAGYTDLHSALRGTTLVTTGEHEYSRSVPTFDLLKCYHNTCTGVCNQTNHGCPILYTIDGVCAFIFYFQVWISAAD